MFVPAYKEAGPAPRPGATYSDGRGHPAIPAFTGVQRPAPALATLPAGVRGAAPPLEVAGGQPVSGACGREGVMDAAPDGSVLPAEGPTPTP